MTSEISNQELSDVIGSIYDCVLDPSLWEPTLWELRKVLDATTVVLALLDTRRFKMLLQHRVGSDQEWIERQVEHYPEIREFTERHLDGGLSMDEPLVVSRLASAEYKAGSLYWNDYMRRQGLIDIAQINIMRSPTRLAMLGIGRHESLGEFDDRGIQRIRLLIPHVRRAVVISNVLDSQAIEKAHMSDALDALHLGVILANEDGRVLHANATARDMMRNEGPLKVTDGGMLRAEGKANAEIRSAVRQAARDESGLGKTGLSVRLSEDHALPVLAHVLPLAGEGIRSWLEPAAAAAVFIGSPVDEANCANAVAMTFGLTPAEANVLGHILTGKNLAETASELGVAHSTARTHLAHIFAKTGVSRQSDLIRLAMRASPVR